MGIGIDALNSSFPPIIPSSVIHFLENCWKNVSFCLVLSEI